MRTFEGTRRAAVVIVVADLLLLALGWFLLVSPQRHTAADAARSANAVREQAAQVQSRLDQAAATPTTQPTIRTADLYQLDKAMPGSADMPDLLLQLDQLARAAGVTLASISPGTAQPGDGYDTVPLSLTFTGNYYTLTDLLYRLRALVAVRHGALAASGRLVSIDSIALAPTDGKTLTASVTAEAYVYDSAAASAATAPPASTDGSDATTEPSDSSSLDTQAAAPTPAPSADAAP